MAENILHFAGFKIRIKGSGVLRSTFKNLDATLTQTLAATTITSAPGKEYTLLANFKTQRALLRLEMTGLDETFDVNRIVLFAKPLWTQYPQ